MVRGPAYGPRVDVVKLAATPSAPVLVTLSIFEDLAFVVPHSSRDGSVVSSRDERQPAQNRRNRHNIDLWIRLRQIKQLSSDQGPDPCVCFRNQRGKKIGDLAGS